MSTKPFSLQSPEQIAKDYGGNKQKIARAAQMGLVDSTAAVLAGMFIDNMRSAQVLEQAPPQTVAQQVLFPQPQAGPPPAPPQGAPPMGMPAQPGMAAPPTPPPPAMGPGLAAGGLASLSVPDGMFDEPANGGFNNGYAGGGIVAFATGNAVAAPAVAPAVAPVAPSTPYGLPGTLADAMQMYRAQFGDTPDTARQELEAYYAKTASPEAIAAQKKKDFWGALAQIGFGMAGSNSPYFLQAAGQAASAALPGMQQAAAARKAQEREGLAARAGIEGQRRAERGQEVVGGTALYGQGIQARESQADRDQRAALQKEELAAAMARTRLEIAARIKAAGMSGGAAAERQTDTARVTEIKYNAIKLKNPAMPDAEAWSQAADAAMATMGLRSPNTNSSPVQLPGANKERTDIGVFYRD
jgi:hypothetical protein